MCNFDLVIVALQKGGTAEEEPCSDRTLILGPIEQWQVPRGFPVGASSREQIAIIWIKFISSVFLFVNELCLPRALRNDHCQCLSVLG